MDFLQALNENLCSLEMSEVLAAIEEAIEGRLLTAEDVQPSNFTSEKGLEREEFLAVKVSPIPIDGVSYTEPVSPIPLSTGPLSFYLSHLRISCQRSRYFKV